MNAREKAQRLMLVTNVRFKLNEAGDIVESDQPIDQAVLDEALNIPQAEYEQRIESQRRDNIVAQLRSDYGMQAAYLAYKQASPLATFDGFARSAVDAVEDGKQENRDGR